MSADDLDDDYFVGDDLVGAPESDGEEQDGEISDAAGERAPLDEELDDIPTLKEELKKKRKREEDGGEEAKEEKKKKKKKPKKARVDRVTGESVLEEAEIKEYVCETFAKPHEDDNLSDYIKTLLPKYEKELTNPSKRAHAGSPRVIIITSSAIRAVNLIRLVKTLGKCAKLFAKHLKVSEQVALLKTEKTPIAVGTPNRILKLLEDGEGMTARHLRAREHGLIVYLFTGALDLEKLAYVILDGSHRDTKERTLFTIPEIKTDLVALLKDIKQRSPAAEMCIY
ncbi:cms1 ribosomal small subunit [Rhizophlyctis rosea]|uniref:Cms1 ribosomal small subunit n=1 Tax=Rhizophlyctis rosea TaxID=64517 RepID=A0AAD5SGB4_9FUNG|nr:cms1 ribosomal small subunit [Rhizophlyctis rosea]